MASKLQKHFMLIFLCAVIVFQSSCDNLSAIFQNFSSSPQTSDKKEQLEKPSYESTLLLEILDNQKMLVEEMRYASDIDDKQSIKESYEKFLDLDKRYQEEFEKHEGALSNKEGLEISKIHHQIIRDVPSYSSLMK